MTQNETIESYQKKYHFYLIGEAPLCVIFVIITCICVYLCGSNLISFVWGWITFNLFNLI